MYCSTVHKTSFDSFIGLQFWSTPCGSSVIVVNIDEQGLFAGKLKVGMQIDRINGKSCHGLGVAEIESYLNGLVGPVTIWASSPQSNVLFKSSGSVAPSVTDVSLHDELSLESLSLEDSRSSFNW